MGKKIWIMNHYAGRMYFNKGGRHYSIAKYLKRDGYEPVIFCSNAKHGVKETFFDTNKLYTKKLAEQIDVPFVFVRCRTYKNNALDRVLNMLDFFFNVQYTAIRYAIKNGKPDVIYASSVHPLTLVAGIILSKIFRVKCICEVRDLWPESIVAYTNKFTKNNPIIKALYLGEKCIYKYADELIFTMEGAYDYIVEKGWCDVVPKNKVHFVNNGVDLETFEYNKTNFKIDDEDLKNTDIFKIAYTGSIRKANNIGYLLDVAKLLNDCNIKFLIWGSGDELNSLIQKVKEENINNVVFKGRVDKQYIPYILSCVDATLAHFENAEILKYGVSLNKLFDYFAAGKPIISNTYNEYDLIKKYNCGICNKYSSPSEYANAIRLLYNSNEDLLNNYYVGTRKVLDKYNYCSLSNQIERIINL